VASLSPRQLARAQLGAVSNEARMRSESGGSRRFPTPYDGAIRSLIRELKETASSGMLKVPPLIGEVYVNASRYLRTSSDVWTLAYFWSMSKRFTT
jgi:hypothetical protein